MGWLRNLFGGKTSPPAPVFDLSEANLRRVLGDANVKHATGLAIEVATGPVRASDARDQVGGVPPNISAEMWPTCNLCEKPLMFVAQIGCGPDEVVRYPERGAIAIFFCNTQETSEPCTIDEDCGRDVFFVASEPVIAPPEVTPVLDNVFHVTRGSFLSCNHPTPLADHTDALYYAWLAQDGGRDYAIELDAFPQWIQGPFETTCSCGAAMDLVVQFDSFDDALNLGDAGRAYVFACMNRCGPRSFKLLWTCC